MSFPSSVALSVPHPCGHDAEWHESDCYQFSGEEEVWNLLDWLDRGKEEGPR